MRPGGCGWRLSSGPDGDRPRSVFVGRGLRGGHGEERTEDPAWTAVSVGGKARALLLRGSRPSRCSSVSEPGHCLDARWTVSCASEGVRRRCRRLQSQATRFACCLAGTIAVRAGVFVVPRHPSGIGAAAAAGRSLFKVVE